MSEIIFDYNSSLIQKKTNESLSLLDEIDELDAAFAPQVSMISSYRPKAKKDKSEVDEIEDANEAGDDWMRTIATFKREPMKGNKRQSSGLFDYFDDGAGKKKKKKKKKENEAIDYGKEFEPEMHLLQNLLSEQARFTASLQKRYDTLENSKTSARGVGKFTTDLISSINQGRSTSLQIANSLSGLKKTIAELNMKERKERAGANGDMENMGDFSANFLKQVLTADRHDLSAYGDAAPIEGDEDDIFASLSAELADSDRSDDIEKYLKYEKRGVQIFAIVDRATDEYVLEARDRDGITLDDYPIPEVGSLTINHSTEVASDEYHTKYPIIWR